jgi:hypothetical protein
MELKASETEPALAAVGIPEAYVRGEERASTRRNPHSRTQPSHEEFSNNKQRKNTHGKSCR